MFGFNLSTIGLILLAAYILHFDGLSAVWSNLHALAQSITSYGAGLIKKTETPATPVAK